MNDSYLRMCGIARKAGKITAGSSLVVTLIRSRKKPLLVLLASDTSDNTKKRIRNGCLFHGIDIIEVEENCAALGHAVGASNGISCIAINDIGFAKAIKTQLNDDNSADIKSAGGAIDGSN